MNREQIERRISEAIDIAVELDQYKQGNYEGAKFKQEQLRRRIIYLDMLLEHTKKELQECDFWEDEENYV